MTGVVRVREVVGLSYRSLTRRALDRFARGSARGRGRAHLDVGDRGVPRGGSACRSPGSRRSPESRRCSRAASRRCTPRCTAPSSRGATSRRRPAARRARRRADRPRRCQPVPVQAGRVSPRGHARRGDRDDRHRRARDDPRRGEEPRLGVRGLRARIATASCSTRLGAEAGRCRQRDARGARRRGVRAHGRLRHRDRQLVHRGRSAARAAADGLRQGRRPRLRREPAPVARPTTTRRALAATCCRWSTQHSGKPLSYNNLLDVDTASRLVEEFSLPGLRDRQARQPRRRQPRRDDRGGVRARLRRRSGLGVRRGSWP